MLYCDNDVLIFDEPTAGADTPGGLDELMKVMKQLGGRRTIHSVHHAQAE